VNILFCDNHLLVVSKPAGLSTQDHLGCSSNLTDLAKAWVKKKYDKKGNVFLEPVHRLDKPVSGLVLFARTSKALSRLQEMMRERHISKTYFAMVEGTLPMKEGTLEHFLVHDEYKARVVNASQSQAKLARLHYKLLEKRQNYSYVEIDLETGRYHQIRVQFAHIGCPIVGDTKYNGGSSSNHTIALRHGRLKFNHPVTKEPLVFEEPLDYWTPALLRKS
jgi:23S rRNA pseudouridine1911/1915/1917 synthase